MNHERLPLREIKQTQADLFNLMLSHDNTDKMTSKEGDSVTVRLNSNVSVGGKTEYIVLSVTIDSARLTLAVKNEDLLSWVNPYFFVTDFSIIPEGIVSVIFKKSLSCLWDWLQTVYSGTLELQAWKLQTGESFASEQDRKFSLTFSLPASGEHESNEGAPGGDVNCLLIDFSHNQTERLIRYFPLREPEAVSSCSLFWPVQISMGYSYFKAGIISRAQQGDIIFFKHVPEEGCLFVRISPLLHLVCEVTADKTLMVVREEKISMGDSDDDFMGPGDEWGGEEDGEDFISEDFINSLEGGDADKDSQDETDVAEEKKTGEEEADEEIAAVDSEEAKALKKPDKSEKRKEAVVEVAEVPVLVSFDVGSTTLSVDDLQLIKKGYCFQLNDDFNNYITLRVHNQIIARGELVKVGEHLGVEVTQTGSKVKSQH